MQGSDDLSEKANVWHGRIVILATRVNVAPCPALPSSRTRASPTAPFIEVA